MYHYLGPPDDPEDAHYFVSAKRFKRQLRLLRALGYEGIGFAGLLAGWSGEASLPEKPIVLTFDDGHRSFYDIGLPLLRQFGFPATMFVITGRVGLARYLSWGQIEEMAGQGMAFESHGAHHRILTRASPDEVEEEIAQSKAILERRLEREVVAYAYRGGHLDEDVKRRVAKAGYRCAVCSKGGFNDPETDRFELKRKTPRDRDNIFRFADKVMPQRKTKSSIAIMAKYGLSYFS